LLDYQEQWAQLETSHNPFSHVVQSSFKGHRNPETSPTTLGVENPTLPIPHRISLHSIRDFGVTTIFRLGIGITGLTLEFDQFVHHYEEVKQMRYVTSFEQRGIQQGLEQGLQQGLEQGLLQQAQEAVVKVLQVRFKKLPKRLVKQLQQIKDREQLSQLLEVAILVNSLPEFESHFHHD
jgi:hypothetical protein